MKMTSVFDDKMNRYLIRWNITGVVCIAVVIGLYPSLMVYLDHISAIYVGLIIGAVISIIPQVALHKLTTNSKYHYNESRM